MSTTEGSGAGIGVCLVARDEAEQIGSSLDQLVPLREGGGIEEVYVVDGGSVDGTDAIAVERGAVLLRAAELMPGFGPVLGKGDSVWRALSAMPHDVLVFLDADIDGDLAGKAMALAAPGGVGRGRPGQGVVPADVGPPDQWGDGPVTTSEGRITELVARPLLAALAPDLARFRDPLGGQIAIRRQVALRIPIVTRYGLEIGMLFDVPAAAGPGSVVEVDLGLLHHRSRPDDRLLPASRDVLATVVSEGAAPGGADRSRHRFPRRDRRPCGAPTPGHRRLSRAARGSSHVGPGRGGTPPLLRGQGGRLPGAPPRALRSRGRLRGPPSRPGAPGTGRCGPMAAGGMPRRGIRGL